MGTSTINVELHCHTCFSHDGYMSFDSLMQTARRIGLDAIAITDHDTVEGAKEFHRLAETKQVPLRIIVGEEKTLADGSHLIGLFLREHIASTELEAAIREIQSQDGVCLMPHPFRRKDGLLRDGLERLEMLKRNQVVFELFNAKCSSADNRRAGELLNAGLSPFGGSDAHYESDLGQCLNVLRWEGDLKTSILRMFRQQAPFQILGRVQPASEPERAYAPLYYRYKKYLRAPRPLLPALKQCYRWYRNKRFGVGPKPLAAIYTHA
jgi:hypothetical protein